MTTTQRPTPTPPAEHEPVTVTHSRTHSPWPLAAAVALACVIGPGTAWLLLYAPLTPLQRLATAAGIPLLLALAAVATTHLDRPTPQ